MADALGDYEEVSPARPPLIICGADFGTYGFASREATTLFFSDVRQGDAKLGDLVADLRHGTLDLFDAVTDQPRRLFRFTLVPEPPTSS